MTPRLLSACTLALALCWPAVAGAQASLSLAITLAPPPLPQHAQPPLPGEGYIWVPGYWSWSPGEAAYYWVPGTWVLAPNDGDLWTPGYWAFEFSRYTWHPGYWGARVGFYGGINYGHGYYGNGYQGGRWQQGTFFYNRAVSNIGALPLPHAAYNQPVPRLRGQVHPSSFNGGPAGVRARPTAPQRQFEQAPHAGPREDQQQHEQAARSLSGQRAVGPRGVPQVAATPQPGAFQAPNVEHARPERARPVPRAPPPVHAPAPAPAPPAPAPPRTAIPQGQAAPVGPREPPQQQRPQPPGQREQR